MKMSSAELSWLLLILSLICRSMTQSCPNHRGGYTNLSPVQSSSVLGIYLNTSPGHLIQCDGVVYAWHYCYYPIATVSGSSNAVFGVYYFDGPSENYHLRPGSYYSLTLSSRESAFTCGAVTLNESQYFNVYQGDSVGVCLSEKSQDRDHQINVIASYSQGSATHWRSRSRGCLESDITESDEDYVTRNPYVIHLYVDINIDECALGEDTCDGAQSTCSDVVGGSGSFQCQCGEGYTSGGGNTCSNIDECSTGVHTCDSKADCIDTVGSFMCQCRAGYANSGPMPGEVCININECLGTASCDPNADCVDTIGSYECVCRAGYTGDGKTSCTSIGECSVEASTCSPNAYCIYIGTSYECVCQVGYNGDGATSCTDINECLTPDTNACDVNADCINTAGSYGCMCRTGYTGNGITCTNVDECEENLAECVPNSDCVDTDASYTCICSLGYTGNGFINCRTVVCSEDCDVNAICAYVNNKTKCVCISGYSGNGYSCTKTTNKDSFDKKLILGLVFCVFGILVVVVVVCLGTIICCKCKRNNKSSPLPNTALGGMNHTSNSSKKSSPNNDRIYYNHPQHTHMVDDFDPSQSAMYHSYDYISSISSQTYSGQGHCGSGAGTGSNERFYHVLTNLMETAGPQSTMNVPMQQYEVDNENGTAHDHEDIIMYCTPATEEEILHSQIMSYGVKDLPSTDIVLIEPLGSGQFGSVSKGLWTCESGVLEVAVKTLTDSANAVKFLQEAAIMAQFKHPNVICIHGIVSTSEPNMIVVELMHNGDLGAFVKGLRPDPGEKVPSNVPPLLLGFCVQIAVGMNYLATKGFVHRDLAARNVLVSTHNICKIADFGMSRDLLDEDYYVAHAGKIPVKWCAPEVLKYKKYSTASDVWSYGCVLYEIWSLGHKPFENITNAQAVQLITSGKRLPPPPGCPKVIYIIMMHSWNMITSQRPDYKDLLRVLTSNKEDVLAIPHEDIPADHTEAGVLGAPLEAGIFLYRDLQQL